MDLKRIADGVRLIIEGVGEDPGRAGLSETPDRVARMYAELFSGIDKDPSCELKILERQKHDEIILLRDIPFSSVCEHHLMPFNGRAHVAYIPQGSITGLSKIARVIETYSRRAQLQERLTTQIADCIMAGLDPQGVMVVIEAEHLCMTMRGVQKAGTVTTTSVVRGVFRRNAATRNEALSLINR